MKRLLTRMIIAVVVAVPLATLFFVAAKADSLAVDFENPLFALGLVDQQDGWSSTGAAGGGCAQYDHAVANNSYGFLSFGLQSLRISDAVTSGCFGDQTFSKSLTDEAGESTAQNTDPVSLVQYSGGTRQQHFEAQFDIASTMATQQSGMHVSVSPDRGDGARMSYVRFEDGTNGIDVFFDDYRDAAPFGSLAVPVNGCDLNDDFQETRIAAGLSRTVPHTVKITMDFVDGPGNDVVKVYIDGNLVHIGTSWEDYFRWCTESGGGVVELTPTADVSRTVDSLIFRTSGANHSADAGNGFLFDNVSLFSGTISSPTVTTSVVTPANLSTTGADNSLWFFYNDGGEDNLDLPLPEGINNSLGSFVSGPGTPPLGVGSAQISVDLTRRRNLATYQFSGTPLGSIAELSFSTYNPSATNFQGPNSSAYLNFNIDFDGTGVWQRRLVFVPSQNGTVVPDSWNEWDAIMGGSAKYVYSGPVWPTPPSGPHAGAIGVPGTTFRTWNDLLADYPGIRIAPISLVNAGWLGLRVGEPYPSGYTENLDKFVLGTSVETKRFDFEPLGTLVVHKDTIGADGTFHFFGDGGLGPFSIVTSGTVGDKQFANIAPGTYHISEFVPFGWTKTFSDCASVTVTAGGTSTCTIVNSKNPKLGEIRGTKYEDRDGDGSLIDGDHHRLWGWTIYLDTNNNGQLDSGEPSTVTDVFGDYRFKNLPAGTYRVREVQKSGWTQTYPSGGTYNVTLAAGQVAMKKDFGNFKLGTISGTKFWDKDGDGRKDHGELGLANWTIRLTKPNLSIVTTTTGAHGEYSFTNLGPGVYVVREVQQAGWQQTTRNPANIWIRSGTVSAGNDFGNKKPH